MFKRATILFVLGAAVLTSAIKLKDGASTEIEKADTDPNVLAQEGTCYDCSCTEIAAVKAGFHLESSTIWDAQHTVHGADLFH